MRELVKKWWFWVIVMTVILCIVVTCIVCINTNTKNNATLTYPELKYFLEEQGYAFETQTIESTQVNYTYFYNEEMSIMATIVTEDYTYMLEYCDKTLDNGRSCCITDTSANTSKEKQEQYNSYLKWKDNIGLTQEQIKEVLLKYYLENK